VSCRSIALCEKKEKKKKREGERKGWVSADSLLVLGKKKEKEKGKKRGKREGKIGKHLIGKYSKLWTVR